MNTLPLVSVVTPCFNAGRYLRATIESVLNQGYPNLEYIVMDGGSTDETTDILKEYSSRLTYVSKPDEGAADAINKGFAISHGEVLGWLNADDLYFPDAVGMAVSMLRGNADAAAIHGEAIWIDANGSRIGRYPTAPCDTAALGRECCVCQPACFVNRWAWEAVNGLNAGLRVSFDYDVWIRLARRYRFVHTQEVLAASRMHVENKTLGQRETVFQESIMLLSQYYGYVPVAWLYGYLSFQRDRRDQFFSPLRHSARTYLQSLFEGLLYNKHHPCRYTLEWMKNLKLSKIAKELISR